jgi:esterase
MSNELHCEEKGNCNNPSLVLLHGLLGSSRNWRSVAKVLSQEYHTLCFDLPNHGKSFHQQSTSVKEMADAVLLRLREMGICKFVICGHSLGGKVAMRIACDQPNSIEKLIVVDIAPRDYPPDHHIPTLEALLELNLDQLSSRKEADLALTDKIPNWAFRQFLLTNLEQKEGQFSWLPKLDTLMSSIASLSSNPLKEEQYQGDVLFICGGKSGYVRSEHHDQIKQFFPNADIKTLVKAGHDVHVEDREGFLTFLQSFLKD